MVCTAGMMLCAEVDFKILEAFKAQCTTEANDGWVLNLGLVGKLTHRKMDNLFGFSQDVIG